VNRLLTVEERWRVRWWLAEVGAQPRIRYNITDFLNRNARASAERPVDLVAHGLAAPLEASPGIVPSALSITESATSEQTIFKPARK
jgi:hypothetical protein